MPRQDYKIDLKDKIRQLAEVEDDPVRIIENSMDFYLGEMPVISQPEDLVDAPEFLSMLKQRHQLNPDEFPMKVKSMELDEDATTLQDWLDQIFQ